MEGLGLGKTAQLCAATRSLFDIPVGVAVTDPRLAHRPLCDIEKPFIAKARSVRRLEFTAGRAAARQAMQEIGLAAQAVPAGPDRAPMWPLGLSGSISHSKSQCVAVVAQNAYSIGIDIEEAVPLDEALCASICSVSELSRIDGAEQGLLAKLIFCAKEAAYKAQYPLTRCLFGFDHLDVILDLPKQSFEVTFLKPAGHFSVGDQLPGRFSVAAEHLVTAVMIGQGTGKGDT